MAIDSGTVSVLRDVRSEQTVLAEACGMKLAPEAFLFSNEPGAMTPPHPDALSHTFASIRAKAKVAPDIHMHSLRHFHATTLDPVISEAQKRAAPRLVDREDGSPLHGFSAGRRSPGRRSRWQPALAG